MTDQPSTPDRRSPLPGSARPPATLGTPAGPVGDEPIEITLVLRRRAPLPAPDAGQQPLDRVTFAERYGADPRDVTAVEDAVRQAGGGIAVVDTDLAGRRVVLRGPADRLADLFGTTLEWREHAGGAYRARSGPLTPPAGLAEAVTAVLGLDDRPQARPQFRVHPAAAAATALTPLQVAASYDFPPGDGAGQTVAILELGGGYVDADISTYFADLGITAPTVVAVPVDGGSNAPTGDPNSADGEVLLDIEVAGAVAPAAQLAVYFAPNTDRGFLDALSTAVHDTTRNPSVVSISWGGPESSWTAQAMQAFDDVCAEAATLGVTVCAAAGDSGSSDGVGDGADHVDFPASSPHVLACGGTTLELSGGQPVETVWNDGPSGGATGGGFSAMFGVPAWQQPAVTGAGRGVPDVAGDADPRTGYRVRVDGVDTVFGGTSAVAPLWSGLLARIAAGGPAPLGFAVPRLYGLTGDAAFRDITTGDNGSYAAAPGWDPCTGLGSPVGTVLADALRGGAGGAGSAGGAGGAGDAGGADGAGGSARGGGSAP